MLVSCEQGTQDTPIFNPVESTTHTLETYTKEKYSKLTGEEQLLLWKSKLESLAKQPLLPGEHLSLIISLKNEVVKLHSMKEVKLTGTILEIAIAIAEITPREDFIQMFESLDKYEFTGSFQGKEICLECIEDMESYSRELSTIQAASFRSGDKANCNCRWTCSFMETFFGGDSTTDCEKTDTGCGFLWTQSCTERWE